MEKNVKRAALIGTAVAGAFAAGVWFAGQDFTAGAGRGLNDSSTLSSMPLEFGLMGNGAENAFADGSGYPLNTAYANEAGALVGAGPDWAGPMPVLYRMEQGQNAFIMGMVDAFDDQNDRPHGRWGISYTTELGGLLGVYDAGYAFQTENGMTAGEISETINTTRDSFDTTAGELSEFITAANASPEIDLLPNSFLAIQMATLSGLRDAAGGQDDMQDKEFLDLRDRITQGHPGFESDLESLQGSISARYSEFFAGNESIVAEILDQNLQRGDFDTFWESMNDRVERNAPRETDAPEP